MAKRPRSAAAPTPEEKQQIEAENPPSNGTPTITKAQAVRDAMARGLDDLDDITAFLKSTYNIEMPRPQISAYKAQAKAKESGGTPRTRSAPQQTATVPPSFGEDLKTIRGLLQQAGGAESLIEQINTVIALHQKYGPSLTGVIEAMA